MAEARSVEGRSRMPHRSAMPHGASSVSYDCRLLAPSVTTPADITSTAFSTHGYGSSSHFARSARTCQIVMISDFVECTTVSLARPATTRHILLAIQEDARAPARRPPTRTPFHDGLKHASLLMPLGLSQSHAMRTTWHAQT